MRKPSTPRSCVLCGSALIKRKNEGLSRWNQRRFCAVCSTKRIGEFASNWRGGIRKNRGGGYTSIYTGENSYIFEHRLVAEKALGRPLKAGEVVHHINCDKTDNRPANLLICNRGYHKWLHDEMGRRYAQLFLSDDVDPMRLVSEC